MPSPPLHGDAPIEDDWAGKHVARQVNVAATVGGAMALLAMMLRVALLVPIPLLMAGGAMSGRQYFRLVVTSHVAVCVLASVAALLGIYSLREGGRTGLLGLVALVAAITGPGLLLEQGITLTLAAYGWWSSP